jgi:Zn-dependent metalloprotease
MTWRRASIVAVSAVIAALTLSPRPAGQTPSVAAASATTANLATLRDWDNRVDRMARAGDLRLRDEHEDTLLPGRLHERLDQLYQGIPVWGGDIARQTVGGTTVSIFGTLYDRIDISTDPVLSPENARDAIARLSGVDMGGRLPKLIILPLEGGGYALTYQDQAIGANDASVYFIDAIDGRLRLKYSLFQNQSAVVRGIGVLGDMKKVSVRSVSGTYFADDALRPPALLTYDMRGDLTTTMNALNGVIVLNTSNLAQDPSTTWTDGPNVDGHTYEGYTYDFYFKRFNRRGLDNNNTRIIGLTHPVRAQDVLTQPANIVSTFYLNAFYCPGCGSDRRGMMMYGEGLPSNVRLLVGGTSVGVRNFAGSIDVVGHELTHGVTAFSSNLLPVNEPGALNEAFSDMMGASVEFFSHPANANYLMGENLVTTPVAGFVRSLQDPLAFGTPDNYAIRLTDTADNGEVHANSTIASHAFYLAIEGGTNRTSGLAVQGVGGANREQIEKVFYRGFTQLLTSNATFSAARAATIQAARDLYGAGTAPEQAVSQAWTAVGVADSSSPPGPSPFFKARRRSHLLFP